ncbi:rhomboid family intramembrane serine protease [Psychrobacter pygoscelis]|uniref:rhomboid family intramembrane serine protease n=1 Tax=Psychrobacter pygoscelis TaxID=2488563 RepID=UPI001F61B3FA|nr:rhomboid family intramembrane serine protease [Psychrobacter pygoscelis]
MNQMTWQNITSLIAHRIKQVVGLYLWVLVPMWLMYFLNTTLLFGLWNRFGIVPRSLDLGSLIGIVASWTMHGSFAHLLGNSLVLIQVLFLFGLFERRAYRTILILIVASGFMTWGLGSPFSIHIGASGLAFAMLGFMIGGAVFAKRWGYLLACIIMGTGYWLTIKQGLIPQDGISFAGHFGGLCAGLLLGANSKHDYPKVSYR